jgi:hypothetical protein
MFHLVCPRASPPFHLLVGVFAGPFLVVHR